MPNGILSAGKRNLLSTCVNEVVVFHLPRIRRQVCVNLAQAQPLDRSADQCCDVRMWIRMQSGLHCSFHIVWPAAFTFGACDEQIISGKSQGTRIPLGGDEADG